nr:E3 ubiquitin-protein ligase RNF213-like [Panthera onca]
MACTEMLTRDILKPSPQAWLQMVKNLSMPLEFLCSDGYLQTCGEMARDVIREVRTQWNRIFPVALFVEHVLLGIESQIPELCELVTEYVFLLNKVSSGSAGALSGDAGAPGLTCRHPRGERPSRSLPILPGSAAGALPPRRPSSL